MPLQATSGAASYDAFGGGVPVVPNYIEEVFSTYLYTGNDTSLTINNGIDLLGKGGLVWTKSRSNDNIHWLVDTVRGVGNYINSNNTSAQGNDVNLIPSFLSTGYTTGTNLSISPRTYVSWTFREQPKFFDIVTYTGNGTNQNIPHNLGSVPGCIIVKRYVGASSQWLVYHRSASGSPENSVLQLNRTDAVITSATTWNATQPTSSVFSVGSNPSVNSSGDSFIAYLFAHDAGGFGLTGTDNVISCGSFTTDGSGNATISLGYEPQWLLVKQSSGTGFWRIWDTMRGWSVATGGGSTADLYPNDSAAENFGGANGNGGFPTATGFYANGGVFNPSQTHIYIAIRRGPMKVPTDATKVLAPVARTGVPTRVFTVTGNLTPDLLMIKQRSGGANFTWMDRLRGTNLPIYSNATQAETSKTLMKSFDMTGYTGDAFDTEVNGDGDTYINYLLKRAPSFFDVVCYTGTGSARTVEHNLAAVPELMIVKSRSSAYFWRAYSSATGNTKILIPNTDDAPLTSTSTWNSTTPTSSVFTLGTDGQANGSGQTFVAYLFATCAGVSKVFSYTGNGSSQTINCGFTGGARFVMIKRTDVAGDWYLWDTARGINADTDPRLRFNSGNSENNTEDTIDAASSGFIVNQASGTDVNVSSATYIGLAIA